MAVSLGELAVRFGCELRGDPDTQVERVATLGNADARSVSFLANPRYRAQLSETRAAAVVLDAAAAGACPTAVLVAANPYATYARIAEVLYPVPALAPGVHPSALVAGSARIDPSAQVAAMAVIGENVSVGARAFVGPHSVLEAGVTLAQDARLVARVTLGPNVSVGPRAVLQPGAVIGGEGFGFAPERGVWLKVPQVGTVQIGADAEIGANTTIDRGAIEDTVIEEGAKLDNLIMIGHNVRVGAHTIIAACTGISGSTTVGKRCMIGGHCGFAGHINIADDVVITGYSMISRSIERPGVYSSGIPFEEAHAWRRLVARFKRLSLLEGRVRRIEQASGLKPQQEQDKQDD
jgi:UDP-3-O-[3-hydroxymyristoyl] glucosamine N-acyltransferase